MIKELALLADAADLSKTKNQLVNYRLDMVRKTGEYERSLIEWLQLTEADQTWVRLKTHFTAAQQQLKKVHGSTMKNTPFHLANMAM
mmetsp:Transcript_9856/g.14431  ORF Transcript_9856/g.14431 Transcript_9856/m.14431 type:complete len:87 (-) Transcript_9856:52-312(-)